MTIDPYHDSHVRRSLALAGPTRNLVSIQGHGSSYRRFGGRSFGTVTVRKRALFACLTRGIFNQDGAMITQIEYSLPVCNPVDIRRIVTCSIRI